MSRYELLVYLHVLAAIVWIGGAFAVQILAIRADRSSDPARMTAIAKDAEWLGMRVFAGAGLALFVLGVLLVLDGPWSFGQLWVSLGIAAYALSFLTGILFLGPESGRISALIDAHGPSDSEVRRRIRRIFLISRIELAILVLIVGDMVVKPTGDDTWILVGGAAFLAAAIVAALAANRGSPADVATPAISE